MTYTAFRIAGKVACIQKVNADGSTTSIPLDPANMDYQEFLKWLKDNPLDLKDQPFTPDQDTLDATAARTDVKTQYQTAVTRLQQIVSATSPTNAQVVAAVQDLATIQLRILKVLKWLI